MECCSVALGVYATVSCSTLSGIASSGADLGRLSYELMHVSEVFISLDNGSGCVSPRDPSLVFIASDGLGGLGMTLPGRLDCCLSLEEIFGRLSLECNSRVSTEPRRDGSGSGSQ